MGKALRQQVTDGLLRLGEEDGQAQGVVGEVVQPAAAAFADLGGVEPAQGVVGIEQVAGRAGGLGPEDEWFAQAQLPGQAGGELGLASAGLAGQQQGPSQQEGNVDGIDQALVGEIALGPLAGEAGRGDSQAAASSRRVPGRPS